MECPKCHRNISDNATSCPYCHKVLSLVCPNCHTIGQNSVCEKCGYIILEKCSKCGKTVSTSASHCKCGFSTKTTVAYNECESDEFASITVEFSALKSIRKLLASQELFAKFKLKLKNLLLTHFRNIEGQIITYGDTYVINLNKELSFPTSASKAIRIALKLINSFSALNLKVQEELGTSLKLNIKILKKNAEELLVNKKFETNVKPLSIKKDEKKYLRGTQIIVDEYVQDTISKEYKTDSLYSIEEEGKTIVFYEIKLGNYILPPNEEKTEPLETIETHQATTAEQNKEEEIKDVYDFKIFNINAKCKFEKAAYNDIFSKLDRNKITSLRGFKNLGLKTSELVDFYKKQDKNVICIYCSEEMNYRPWGLLEEVFRQYYKISFHNSLIKNDLSQNHFKDIVNLIMGNPRKANTPEDARFGYMDDFVKFLKIIKNTVLIVEGFENIDDTTLQTLEIYFDNYKNINTDFIFITDDGTAVHSKIKSLIRTPLYKEIKLQKSKMENLISEIKEDAEDFIHSFYYEKIKSNFSGSKLYFDNAIKYLKEKNVLISFENKLLVKSNDSVFLPSDIEDLIKTRLKAMGHKQEASMILAYLALINSRLNSDILEKLEVKDIQENIEYLKNAGFVYTNDDNVFLNNPDIVIPVVISSLKKNVLEFLSKNILAKIGQGLNNTVTLLLMGKLSLFKDEYLLLWKNAAFGIATGDYDSYLKNTLGFMMLIDQIKGNIPDDEIEEHKKQVYHNILMSLYAYSPEKIYDIEQILLADAIDKNDKENTVKLSNLMLQGALISGRWGDAIVFLNNILQNMPNPKLIVDGAINTKFFLLSLVNIEILFNIGDFKSCIDVSNDLLDVLSPDVIKKIKPVSFSVNLFVGHLTDTFRLGAFAYILSVHIKELDSYFEKIKSAIGEDLPDKEAIIDLAGFMAGKNPVPDNIEKSTPFSKILYLIMQEFSEKIIDYKNFAQNIYQAKLLADDINQFSLKYICELFIAYAYSKSGIFRKAESIYKDIIEKTEVSANINILLLAKYFLAELKISRGEIEGGLLIINDTLAFACDNAPQENLIFVLLRKLLTETAEFKNIGFIDIESEKQKLLSYAPNGELARFIES